MKRAIIQIGDKRLLQQSKLVDPADLIAGKHDALIADMLETGSEEGLNSVGLSAVQIGSLLQIFISRRIDKEPDPDKAEWEVVINPTVTVLDSSKDIMWEGCLSIGTGPGQLFAPVVRPNHVRLDYINRTGEKQSLIAQGYFAHVVQHEVDHLNGKLFLSYVKNPANIWRSDKLDKYIQKRGEYPAIVE